MTKDNSTGKDKEFYELGKKMFDRIRVSPEHQAMIQRGVDRTTPPKREWVGLTDKDIKDVVGRNDSGGIGAYTREMFKQIEAKLKDKNT